MLHDLGFRGFGMSRSDPKALEKKIYRALDIGRVQSPYLWPTKSCLAWKCRYTWSHNRNLLSIQGGWSLGGFHAPYSFHHEPADSLQDRQSSKSAVWAMSLTSELWATSTFELEDTRSMAPPMPCTVRSGRERLALLLTSLPFLWHASHTQTNKSTLPAER